MYRMEIATENTPSKKAFWVPLQISHPCPCLHALWLTLAVRWRGKVSSTSLDYLSWALKTHLYLSQEVLWDTKKARVGLKVKGEVSRWTAGKQVYLGRERGKEALAVLVTFHFWFPIPDNWS